MIILFDTSTPRDAIEFFGTRPIDTVSVDDARSRVQLHGSDRIIAISFDDLPQVYRSGILPRFIADYLRSKGLLPRGT